MKPRRGGVGGPGGTGDGDGGGGAGRVARCRSKYGVLVRK